jgi:hypothetical protein
MVLSGDRKDFAILALWSLPFGKFGLEKPPGIGQLSLP